MTAMLFRIRVLLRMKGNTRLHAYHAGVLHALLAAAWGQANKMESVLPDGLLLDAPEQCRISLQSGDFYAFGFTLLDVSPVDAARRIHLLFKGLKVVGRSSAKPKTVFGGNFEIQKMEDLVAGKTLSPVKSPTAISRTHLFEEAFQLSNFETLTLRFRSPLLASRPRNLRIEGHGFFDRKWFGVSVFLSRLQRRAMDLGFLEEPIEVDNISAVRLIQNDLVWLDFSYGPRQARKAKAGAMGRVTFSGLSKPIKNLLVIGQYLRIGEATRFGFGYYRLEELGQDPFRCKRYESLLQLSIRPESVDRYSIQSDAPSGKSYLAADNITKQEYEPDPSFRISVSVKEGAKRRVLTIPSRTDRVFQRCVLDFLIDAIDLFLEESSLAYRKGLGTQRAARRLKEFVGQGYHWALKADFQEFFDSIDHRQLRQRLDAYLNDDRLVPLIMKWVKSDSKEKGIPTGAPISPLLANLFLDRFDELIHQAGGKLVRYADDFLVLYKDRDKAESAFQETSEIAEHFQLKLNQQKSNLLDLTEPFEFLGFQFRFRQKWSKTAIGQPVPVQDLGWHQKKNTNSRDQCPALSGESEVSQSSDSIVICGPNVSRIDSQGKQLVVDFRDGKKSKSLPLEKLRQLVLIGTPTISSGAFSAMVRFNLSWYLLDSFGVPKGSFVVNDPMDSHLSLVAQANSISNQEMRLSLARKLIYAKLANFAELASKIHGKPKDFRSKAILEELACHTQKADSISGLMGLEGAGAARWYGQLEGRLAGNFHFHRRTAPGARDPINALLNVGYTVLQHFTSHMIGLVGLAPALGFMHSPSPGHATLASDLQEPFRHLVDRVVIRTTKLISRSDFVMTEGSSPVLRVKPRAMKIFLENFHQDFSKNCQSQGQSMPKPYWMQVVAQIRSLRLSFIKSDPELFRPFLHP